MIQLTNTDKCGKRTRSPQKKDQGKRKKYREEVLQRLRRYSKENLQDDGDIGSGFVVGNK